MPTKFEQRNKAAGKMTGSQVAMGVATGKMSAKDVANAMGKTSKPAAPTKPNATKTSGSNVKPTTTKTTATKSMKTQNIPEVTVSVKKKVVAPVTPVMKEKGKVDVNKYVERQPGGEYREITLSEYSSMKKSGKNVQQLNPSLYEREKGRIAPMKKSK
jgi:hypothetical protein